MYNFAVTWLEESQKLAIKVEKPFIQSKEYTFGEFAIILLQLAIQEVRSSVLNELKPGI